MKKLLILLLGLAILNGCIKIVFVPYVKEAKEETDVAPSNDMELEPKEQQRK